MSLINSQPYSSLCTWITWLSSLQKAAREVDEYLGSDKGTVLSTLSYVYEYLGSGDGTVHEYLGSDSRIPQGGALQKVVRHHVTVAETERVELADRERDSSVQTNKQQSIMLINTY